MGTESALHRECKGVALIAKIVAKVGQKIARRLLARETIRANAVTPTRLLPTRQQKYAVEAPGVLR